MRTALILIWAMAGAYFVVASMMGGGLAEPLMAMVCGFMVAHNSHLRAVRKTGDSGESGWNLSNAKHDMPVKDCYYNPKEFRARK